MTSTPPVVLRKMSGIPDVTHLTAKKTALLLIGFQAEHFTGLLPVDKGEELLPPTVKMTEWADKHKMMTVHIRHQSKGVSAFVFAPDSAGQAFYPPIVPTEKHTVVTKYAPSAFAGTNLHTVLESSGIDTLILCGMPTPSAIMTTAHDARRLGYKCFVAADLTASRDVMSWDGTRVVSADRMQETALANIADEYAPVLNSATIMAMPVEK